MDDLEEVMKMVGFYQNQDLRKQKEVEPEPNQLLAQTLKDEEVKQVEEEIKIEKKTIEPMFAEHSTIDNKFNQRLEMLEEDHERIQKELSTMRIGQKQLED